MTSNPLQEKSYALALTTSQLCMQIMETKKEYVLSKQLLRSSTSIGANLREVAGAQSRNDLIAKLHIALKEERETEYWLQLLCDLKLYTSQERNMCTTLLDEVIAMTVYSLKTAKYKTKE